MDSHVRPAGFRQNLKTEQLGPVPRQLPDFRAAYGLAREVARSAPACTAVGHRLVWCYQGSFASCPLHAHADAFAVVGRHTQCGVALPDDPFVALRHLLVRSIALPSGGVALRVLDLHTNLGFVLPDGSRHVSIFAEGPVAIAVGEYVLVALPQTGEELPGDLPQPEMKSPDGVRAQLEELGRAMSPYRANARPVGTSRITLMPRPVMVGEPMQPSLGRLASGGAFMLTLARGERSATVPLAEEDLVRGVMIGRSEKCHSEMLRRITDVSTSRAHVLLLREQEHVYAYDLASTQGTFENGAPARRAILRDSGSTLLLGRGADAVRLVWNRR